MYSLRKVSRDNVESNVFLGKNYSVLKKDHSPVEFENALEAYYGPKKNDELLLDLIYAFIDCNCILYPLSKDYQNYIVSENGNTYQNLTFK